MYYILIGCLVIFGLFFLSIILSLIVLKVIPHSRLARVIRENYITDKDLEPYD